MGGLYFAIPVLLKRGGLRRGGHDSKRHSFFFFKCDGRFFFERFFGLLNEQAAVHLADMRLLCACHWHNNVQWDRGKSSRQVIVIGSRRALVLWCVCIGCMYQVYASGVSSRLSCDRARARFGAASCCGSDTGNAAHGSCPWISLAGRALAASSRACAKARATSGRDSCEMSSPLRPPPSRRRVAR